MKIKLLALFLILAACTGKREENYEITEDDKRVEEEAIRIVDDAVANMDQSSISSTDNTLGNSTKSITSTSKGKEVSKFVVSSLYHKKPSVVKVTLQGDIYYASYINSEGETNTTKIQFIGNNIRWGSSDGRWREHPLDEELSYEIKGRKVLIKIRYSDGSESVDEYQL